MSVTVTINNNLTYCRENNLIEVSTEPCLCADAATNKGRPGCGYCSGSGVWTENIYPFEMNLANANFATLWASLGLEAGEDLTGVLDARIVGQALASFDDALLHRATRHYLPGEGSCEAYDFGISDKQANSYITRLTAIVNEAQRREEPICWS